MNHLLVLCKCSTAISITLEPKLTILALSPILIGGRGPNTRSPKHKRNLNGLIPFPSNIDSQLAQLSHMFLVDKLCISFLSFVEHYAHYGLTSADGTVDLCVDLVDGDGVAFEHERVEHVLAELLAFDYYFLLLWV